MMTVTEIAKQTGISVRTLHHYDAIGLLKPTQVTEAGYRLYDTDALEKLYLILLFREIGFPLKQIRQILDAPDYDRNRVLEQQIALMERKLDVSREWRTKYYELISSIKRDMRSSRDRRIKRAIFR